MFNEGDWNASVIPRLHMCRKVVQQFSKCHTHFNPMSDTYALLWPFSIHEKRKKWDKLFYQESWTAGTSYFGSDEVATLFQIGEIVLHMFFPILWSWAKVEKYPAHLSSGILYLTNKRRSNMVTRNTNHSTVDRHQCISVRPLSTWYQSCDTANLLALIRRFSASPVRRLLQVDNQAHLPVTSRMNLDLRYN